MVSRKLDKQAEWVITLTARRKFFSKRDADFVAELASEEARKVRRDWRFILHDMVESKKYFKLFIEGERSALLNLLAVMRDNFECKIAYSGL